MLNIPDTWATRAVSGYQYFKSQCVGLSARFAEAQPAHNGRPDSPAVNDSPACGAPVVHPPCPPHRVQ
jgi:hypothetical protein